MLAPAPAAAAVVPVQDVTTFRGSKGRGQHFAAGQLQASSDRLVHRIARARSSSTRHSASPRPLLDRNVAIQLGVPGAKHFPHPAGPKGGDSFVRAKVEPGVRAKRLRWIIRARRQRQAESVLSNAVRLGIPVPHSASTDQPACAPGDHVDVSVLGGSLA